RPEMARDLPHPCARRSDTVSCCAPGSEAIAATSLPSDEEVLLAARDLGNGTRQVELSVPNVHCAGCIRTVESALSELAGVESARLNLSTRRVSVRWRGEQLPPIVDALDRAGYPPHLFDDSQSARDPILTELLRAVAVSGFAAVN